MNNDGGKIVATVRQITQGRNTWLRLRLALAAGLILLALVATGCGLTPTTTPRASDQWSNGKLLGTAILNNQVALQVDEAGNNFMVWVGPEHELPLPA